MCRNIDNFENYETSQMLKDKHCLIHPTDMKCPQWTSLWKQEVA